MDDAVRILQSVFDRAPGPPDGPAPEPGDGEEEPRPLLQFAVAALAAVIFFGADLVVWHAAFVVTNLVSPNAGRGLADRADSWFWGFVAFWCMYIALCRRLGWR